jgi:hypothetical protein
MAGETLLRGREKRALDTRNKPGAALWTVRAEQSIKSAAP